MASNPAVSSALEAFRNDEYTSLRAAAAAYNVSQTTLNNRARGTPTCGQAREIQQLLIPVQELLVAR